jgi:hypothetical protein
MTTVKLNNIVITTDHPTSSYNIPIALFNGNAYGHEDWVREPGFRFMLAGLLVSSELLKLSTSMNKKDIEFVHKFLNITA